nr:NADH dehydrogenase subunit 4L [Microphthalmus listensis]
MALSWTVMYPLMVVFSIFALIKQRQHLLMSLLALEGVILSLILLVMVFSGSLLMFLVVILLTWGACEASLGLGCLVSMIRSMGSDHMNMLSINKC